MGSSPIKYQLSPDPWTSTAYLGGRLTHALLTPPPPLSWSVKHPHLATLFFGVPLVIVAILLAQYLVR